MLRFIGPVLKAASWVSSSRRNGRDKLVAVGERVLYNKRDAATGGKGAVAASVSLHFLLLERARRIVMAQGTVRSIRYNTQ